MTVDLVSFFHLLHGRVHSSKVSSVATLADLVFGALTDEQMRVRPGKRLNSLVWLVWHMARVEDVCVNLVIVDGRQIFEDTWGRRLGVRRWDIGTGMTDEEVEAMSAAIDLPNLRGYRAAVGRRTQDVARELPDAEWDQTVDAAIVREAAAQGAFTPASEWVARFWEGKSKGWFLYWLGVGHNYLHLGHAGWVKEMLLSKRGR